MLVRGRDAASPPCQRSLKTRHLAQGQTLFPWRQNAAAWTSSPRRHGRCPRGLHPRILELFEPSVLLHAPGKQPGDLVAGSHTAPAAAGTTGVGRRCAVHLHSRTVSSSSPGHSVPRRRARGAAQDLPTRRTTARTCTAVSQCKRCPLCTFFLCLPLIWPPSPRPYSVQVREEELHHRAGVQHLRSRHREWKDIQQRGSPRGRGALGASRDAGSLCRVLSPPFHDALQYAVTRDTICPSQKSH